MRISDGSSDVCSSDLCPDRSDARYWGWEVGGGRITRQPGQVRKEAAVTRFRSGSLFQSPTRPIDALTPVARAAAGLFPLPGLPACETPPARETPTASPAPASPACLRHSTRRPHPASVWASHPWFPPRPTPPTPSSSRLLSPSPP